MRTLIVVAWFFLISSAYGQQVFPSGKTGSYNLTLPPDDYVPGNTYDVIGGGATGYSYVTKGPNYVGPFQSHQWWTSALWNVNLGDGTDGEVTFRGDWHSERMYPYPMILTATSAGFEMEYRPNANGGVSSATQVNNGPVLIHMRAGFIGQNSTQTSVDGYGDWHAIFRQTFGADVLKATAASGSPYLFLERSGTTDLQFFNQGTSTLNAIYTDANVEAISITADPQNSAVTQATIGIFFPPGTTVGGFTIPGLSGSVGNFSPFGATFNADIPDSKKYITVAVLPDASQATLTLFAQHAFNFITQTSHSYSFDEANAMLTTNFDVTTTNVYGASNTGTLQALYRHQWLYSPQVSGATNTGLQYFSPRGSMKLINSNSFQTQMPHLGILPNLGWANTGNKTTLNTYITNYASTVSSMPSAADGYNKDAFTELTTNLQIAHQIGNMTAFNTILTELRNRLQDWLVANDGDYNRYFAYSPTFNHMSHYPNGFGSSGTMVDAHFHIGYIVMAAAILARYDQTFVSNYGPMVETVIRSIDNETKDMTDPGSNGTVKPWFPYLKYFDPYAGHSWADAKASNQESVSESINFAAAVLLWGETTQNTVIRDLGALLYITESEAGRQYWFDVDQAVNGSPYATAYTHQHLTMGGNYATFFGTNPEYIHGITYLPMTGASTWLGTNSSAAATEYSQIAGNYGSWGGWGETINAQQATHNPSGAIAAFNTYSGSWSSDKYAYTYHWDHTFDSVGTIDATVRASTTGYQVFTKNNCKHYMVYMPKGKGPKTVNFTDGQSFNVPDDTVIVYRVCTTLPVDLVSFEAKNINNQYNQLGWTTGWEKNNEYFSIERSKDGINWEEIGVVRTKGNGKENKEYYYLDYNPYIGLNYYRLKQVDTDGTNQFSGVVKVYFGNVQASIEFYPNPSSNYVYFKNSTSESNQFQITIKDLFSRTVIDQQLFFNPHSERMVDLHQIADGMYLIEMVNIQTMEKQTGKLIKK